jgi:DNA-binding MarR family transcriptional regulator
MSGELSKQEESVGYLLWHVSLLRQKHVSHLLKPLELTPAQLVILSVLMRMDAPATQIQLAEQTRTDVAMNSQILKALEKRGLVHRTVDSHDARAKRVVISTEGRALVEAALPLLRASDRAFFNLSETEYTQLQGLLGKLYLIHQAQE